MKKFFATLGILCTLLSLCCTSPPIARAPDLPTVTVWRDFELVLHVDTDFNHRGREQIEKAAGNIRRLTHDRARLSVVFDLDFQSLENLKMHKATHHSQVVGVTSDFDIVQTIDAIVGGPGMSVLAATAPTEDGSYLVVLVLDRIAEPRFEAVVTHEFGHVIGLPDLEASGAIMSGAETRGAPVPNDWTPADVALCRTYRYCD